MAKEISVGNTVDFLMEQYSRYTPCLYLKSLSLNQAGKDERKIQKLQSIDNRLSNILDNLCVSLLSFDSGSVSDRCKEALDLLVDEYKKSVDSLNGEFTQRAKSLYKDWNLKWMLEYIKESDMEYDEEYAREHRLDCSQEVASKIRDLRDSYGIEVSEEDTDC